MKTIVKVALLSAFSLLMACSSNTEPTAEKTEIKAENVVVADFAIDGMVCAMGCAKTIEDEVLGMNGVAASSVDYESGKAHFEYDKTQLTEAELIAKIESLADGQYHVKPWTEPTEESVTEISTEESSNTSTEEDKAKVKVKIPNFQIPNLFTFLINQV
ncbi:MAG: cation transporter [Bacteroidetes bacterium]|nr:cation transporter [Bacteroidota bacterium]